MIPDKIQAIIDKQGFSKLRPCQEKAVNAGLFDNKNMLVCTPTGSGKTKVAEFAFLNHYFTGGKSIYIVPLKALATEKFRNFKKDYPFVNTALSIGSLDGADPYLAKYDLIICTSEKLDSLIRHKTPWLSEVKCVIIDEIHLLNDVGRGPTLEILITLLNSILDVQIIGLSATIGNPQELADWLQAELIYDEWRPVPLKKAVLFENKLEFVE